jgi:hypothetical protein
LVDPNESVAKAAIREAREETGLDVELERLVGIYSRTGSGVDVHGALFVAQPVDGVLEPQVGEVLELGYFNPDALPEDMLWWHRQPVADVFAGVGHGVAWSMQISPHQQIDSREMLYALRDRSELSRSEFYRYFFEDGGMEANLEVGER